MTVIHVLLLTWILSLLLAGVISQENTVQYIINEELRPSAFVGDIPQDTNLRSQIIPPEAFDQLTYTLLSSSSPFAQQFFNLEESDGILRIAGRIDRDAPELCYQKIKCEIKLDVAVQPRDYFQIIKVSVIIGDINDNFPAFLEPHFQRSIAENTNPGASFTIPTADDPDSPKYGVKRYELVSGMEEFGLKVTNTSDGSMDLHLVLRAEVDREQRELYQVVVAAYDGGVPPNMGTLTADIIILDLNDNSAVFDNETYHVVIPENIAVNQVVLRVHAKDPDMGVNGQIVYSFSSKTRQRFGHLFAIHNASGEITVKQTLHYEDGSSYTLSVEARDKNPESLTTLAKVTIDIEDINDNPPHITVNALTSSGSVEISEGESIGSLVAHISVEDPDSGAGGQFTCELDSPKFTTQQLYGGIEYKVVTAAKLDREVQDQYELDFVCTDQGNPVLSSTAHISVTVLDENDNPPEFSSSTYTTTMEENNEIGAYITTVSATDLDLGVNGQVEYRAAGDANSLLTVDSQTGAITSRISFDYENNQRLEIPILAVDRGEPPLTATATVVITFTDVDDQRPEFTQDSFTFKIPENEAMGTEVGQVTAIDADSALYNEFTYFLSPSDVAFNSFVLDQQNGKIFTKKTFDRETKAYYQFEVKAVSKNPPLRSSSTMVNVLVTDKNDHFPYCTFPSIKNNTAYIVRAMTPGETVAMLNCTDDDTGLNSRLRYKFLSLSQEHIFGIAENSGVIFTKSEFKAVQEQAFPIMVQVSDSGTPPKSIDLTLNLVVNKSMSDPNMVSSENLTIVISVAVCSAVLVVLLIIAILIVIRRKDKRKKYVDKKVLVAADASNKGNIPVRTVDDHRNGLDDGTMLASLDNGGKQQGFTNGIGVSDEQQSSESLRPEAPGYPAPHPYSTGLYSKVRLLSHVLLARHSAFISESFSVNWGHFLKLLP